MLTNIVCSNLTELPVVFYHQDKAKSPGQMFQWPPGENTYITICTNTNTNTNTHFVSPESRGGKITVRSYPMKVLGGRSTPAMADLRAFVKVNLIPAIWLTLYDILGPQESQIIRVASPDFNLAGVVDRIGSGLLYVDHGAHTPLVIIARNNGLFG